jgi:transposase
VIDLLPDRGTATLATWLKRHPELEVVSRDRAGACAEGIRQGAPQAIQVADRFHLHKNVTDAWERFLTRKHAALWQAVQDDPADAAPALPGPFAAAAPPQPSRAQAERHARRPACGEEVVA